MTYRIYLKLNPQKCAPFLILLKHYKMPLGASHAMKSNCGRFRSNCYD